MKKIFRSRVSYSLSDNRQSRIQNRKLGGLVAIAFAFVLVGPGAQAQQPAKIPRIGFLISARSSTASRRIQAFHQGLRELGHVEGKNIIIEYRYAEGKIERLPDLADELVRLKVDIIVTDTSRAIQVAQNATKTIPVVFTTANDPVGDAQVASLARPGGNLTGLSLLTPDLNGKRLELLKDIAQHFTGSFLNRDHSDLRATFQGGRNCGQRIGIATSTSRPERRRRF